MSQSPIFVKTCDLLLWLLPATLKFPREQRFVLAKHVQETAIGLQERLIEAGSLPQSDRRGKLARLHQANVELTKLRFHLRLCRDLELLTSNQHRHVSQMVDEVGRLLGGWFKSLGSAPPQADVPE